MRLRFYIILGLAAILASSCHKDWLDIKRDKRQVVPATLKDIEALLGNSQVMTERMPYLGELASGDFFIDEQYVSGLDELIRGSYLWTNEPYGSLTVVDWNNRHEQIFYANTALAALDRLSEFEKTEQWRRLKGSALFYRAWAIYQLAQLFCMPYDPLSAHTDPGIPFLLEADVNLRPQRGTVQQTYDRILADLNDALPLLPEMSIVKTRPSKAAIYGLLARYYMLTGNYEMALGYVDLTLAIHDTLIDYNNLDISATIPFQRFNSEVIYRSAILGSYVLTPPYFSLDRNFLSTFAMDDLRRALYFDFQSPQIGFKGSYDGDANSFFSGIATDELHLIKAECLARTGQTEMALATLNHLLTHRYKTGTFQPYQSMTTGDLIELIVEERRKSLCFRGLRWTDLRRLSLDPNHSIAIHRTIAGQPFSLSPENPNYVFFFPEKEILLNPMEQNIRY